MPRPSAAASPSSSAVPDGASTLWRWCISRISMSKSSGAERARRLLDQHRQQVDAEAHIAGLDDGGMARGGRDLRVVVGRAAGGADDMDDARLRGIAGEFDRRGRRGEIEHAVGLGEGRQRIVGDRHADACRAGELAGILAEMRRAGALDRAGDARARHGVDGADQRLAHAAGRAHHDQPHVAHARVFSCRLLRCAGSCWTACVSSTSPSPFLPCTRWKRA